MKASFYKNQQVVEWFEQLLLERFGVVIYIKVKNDREVELVLADDDSFILLESDPDTFNGFTSELSYSAWNAENEGWNSCLTNPIPAPGASSLKTPLIEKTELTFRINYDILGLAYWMLCRLEEVDSTNLDDLNRFPATASHAFKYGYLERPVVDEWFNILGQVINRKWPQLQLKNNSFNMKLSHDVDLPSSYGFGGFYRIFRTIVGDVVKRRQCSGLLLGPLIRLRSQKKLHTLDPANTFKWIMDISEQHGLKSAFYFICGRTDKVKDADYEIEHPSIRHLMKEIYKRGHEIGLHPSYNTYLQPDTLSRECERLKKVCYQDGLIQSEWGGRMHYLRWKQPQTLQAWDRAGMDYDSTLGYADLAGFRCGTCFEYPGFDPVEQRKLDLRIRPLIAMDCTVMRERYMGLGTGDAAYSKFLQLKDACKAVGGTFTLLWHNSELASKKEKELYMRVVSG